MLKLFKCIIIKEDKAEFFENSCVAKRIIEYIFETDETNVKNIINNKYPDISSINVFEINILPGLTINLNRYNLTLEDNELQLSMNN